MLRLLLQTVDILSTEILDRFFIQRGTLRPACYDMGGEIVIQNNVYVETLEKGMAGSVNKVILIGNLGRDPEIRHTNDGRPIANLSIATSEQWRDRSSGERREKTEWHRVVVFDEKICEVAQKYLQKGSTVYLEGSLQTRKWTDQQGVEKYTTEVVLQRFSGKMTMLGSRGSGGEIGDDMGSNYSEQGSPMDSSDATPAIGGAGDLDDEIPF